jgi:D-alanyl-lipoteichoic acid acyltransferase DltB (MBOAT superfamily)
MVFSSHLFLLLFLPLTLAGFHLLAREGVGQAWPRRFLILASLVFYGWWSWFYLGVLIATIAGNFLLGRRILGAQDQRQAKRMMWLGIAGNLALLGYYKYAHFFLDNLNLALGTHWSLGNIILPLAISFHTFQQIAFLVTVYKGRDAEASFERYLLFVLFFPQLIAGPIVRHEEIAPQFSALARPSDRARDLAVGLSIFIVGLAKKVLLADPLAPIANTAFAAAQSGAVEPAAAWLGALAYTLQLYFDFSGYSEMAVGLGRMFGIRLPINFWSPYQAKNITQFWRRWHITLSRFLRDFLYIPLGGNRVPATRSYFNLLLTMLLGGLWHGAAWTFVIWGGYHGLLLMLHRAWRARRASAAPTVWGAGLAAALTFLSVVVGWVFFRAPDFATASHMLQAMVRLGGLRLGSVEPLALVQVLLLLFVAWYFPNTWQWLRRQHPVSPPADERLERGFALRLDWRWSIGLAVAGAWAVLAAHRYTEFLYFQF